MFLKNEMKEGFDYFVEKVNQPLVKAIIILAGRYPEPTHENCLHPNTHILLNLRDEFFRCWDTGWREPLFRALWRVLIVKYEHSPTYRNMLDWVLMMLQKTAWKSFNPTRQMRCWRNL